MSNSLHEEKRIGKFVVRLFKEDPECDGESWMSFSHGIPGGGMQRLFTHTYPSFERAKETFDLVCQTTSDVLACTVQDIKGAP